MKYLSVCSGIEAATVAWHPLGWEPVAFGEIEKFPSQVLAHHYPDTPNWGDMTKFKEWQDADVNVFVGGTPCQSFSVAGLRKGLDDPRGNLMLTYLAIAAKYRPQWLVWENVPGVLSSNGGLDFASLLRGMGELGYGFAYRILDAQYFGVAQRRRRVFVIGYLGNWRPAAAVLFERHSLSGHPAPSREKRQRVADTLTVGANQCSGFETDVVEAFRMVAFGEYNDNGSASAIKARDYKDATDLVTQPISIHPHCIGRAPDAGPQGKEYLTDGSAYCMDSRGQPQAVMQPIGVDIFNGAFTGDTAASLTKRADGTGTGPSVMQPIAFSGRMSNPQTDVDMTQTLQATNPMAVAFGGDIARTLQARHDSSPCADRGIDVVAQAMAVRRLTPVECERLQGFPDNYTDLKYKGKPTPDGPRYKALGNSMAVPVMAWIGKRIKEVDAICQTQKQ